LDPESVRYVCKYCGHPHFEHDKPRFISQENCFWKPTAIPVEPHIRSYRLPSFLSLLTPWSEAVGDWLTAMDIKTGKTKDIDAMQSFYNNHLGETFELLGGKIKFEAVSGHRRRWYHKGEINNKQIEQYCDTGILFLTCSVDVHKSNLAVAVWGWTAGFTCWLIDYQRFTDESENGCEVLESPAWGKLKDLIDYGVWTADDGKQYKLIMTLIDSGYAAPQVCEFAGQWEHGVYPIVGRDRPAKAQSIKEFAEFTTVAGTTGYRILVDHYKDRLAPALRRDWHPGEGLQPSYTFNAPVDTEDHELKELTREYRREKKHPNGEVTYYWHRPGNAPQELWDLMVYGHASVEILAWILCVQDHQMEMTDWLQFWEHCKTGAFYTESGNSE
jgi:phage terminase large subunit GpA-like protein